MTTAPRCPWVDLAKPDYIDYHDREWGVPVHDDQVFFEFLTLEAAQAGLSWYTVLRKWENYRRAFADFQPAKVARFQVRGFDELLRPHAGHRDGERPCPDLFPAAGDPG